MTEEQVAGRPDGVNIVTLRKVEAGKPGVTSRTLGRLASIYGVGIDVMGAAYFAAMSRGAA